MPPLDHLPPLARVGPLPIATALDTCSKVKGCGEKKCGGGGVGEGGGRRHLVSTVLHTLIQGLCSLWPMAKEREGRDGREGRRTGACGSQCVHQNLIVSSLSRVCISPAKSSPMYWYTQEVRYEESVWRRVGERERGGGGGTQKGKAPVIKKVK
jgi:hypothetical protein